MWPIHRQYIIIYLAYVYGWKTDSHNRHSAITSYTPGNYVNNPSLQSAYNANRDTLNRYDTLFDQRMADEFYFVIIASGIIALLTLILILYYCGCCGERLSSRARTFLLLLILLLLFAIAVTLALRTSENTHINHDRSFPNWDSTNYSI